VVEFSHRLADGVFRKAERKGKGCFLGEEAWKKSLQKVVSGFFPGQKPLKGSVTGAFIQAQLEKENGSEVLEEALGSTGGAV